MKIIPLFILAFFISFSTYGQSAVNKDSLAAEICNTFHTEKKKTDSLSFANILLKHRKVFEAIKDANERENFYQIIILKAQQTCEGFAKMIDETAPKESDSKRIDKEPASLVDKNDCIKFYQIKNFRYLENNGDITKLFLTDSTWTDLYKDGTYSSSSLKKINEYEFIISFIESNNPINNGFSKVGDKYRYKILEKHEGYYLLLVQAMDSLLMQTFKLYY